MYCSVFFINTRESGEWNKLPPNEREQQAGYLQHIGMIARFDNILGRKTIQTIKMLTTEIKSIFCHPTMMDRIASMLNYLLLQLVGPNKKNLKVILKHLQIIINYKCRIIYRNFTSMESR